MSLTHSQEGFEALKKKFMEIISKPKNTGFAKGGIIKIPSFSGLTGRLDIDQKYEPDNEEKIVPREIFQKFKNIKLHQFDAGSGMKPGNSFEETIKWLESQGIPIPDELVETIGNEVFFASVIASIAKAYQLQAVIESSLLDIGLGLTFEEWKLRMVDELIELPDYVQERIFRNNLQSSYSFGRAVHHKKNVGTHPMLTYRAINDSRTRETHAAMDGFTAPQDDPIWEGGAYPPNGFNCRCSVVAKTKEKGDIAKAKYEADRKKAGEPIRPDSAADEGWNFSPLAPKGPILESSVNSAIKNTNDAFKPYLERVLKGIAGK